MIIFWTFVFIGYYCAIAAAGLTLAGIVWWCMFYVSCQLLDLVYDAKAMNYFWECWRCLNGLEPEINSLPKLERHPCD